MFKTSKHGKPAAKYAWDTPMWQPRRYAKINWKQEFKSLTQRDKIFPYISWECCHHQFQDFEASFFPVEYSFAHLLFVSEVFKVNFDRE